MLSSINKKLNYKDKLFVEFEEETPTEYYNPKGLPREQIEGLGIYEWKENTLYEPSNIPSNYSYATRKGKLYRALIGNKNEPPENSLSWSRVLDFSDTFSYASSVGKDNVSLSTNNPIRVRFDHSGNGFIVTFKNDNGEELFDTVTFDNRMFNLSPENLFLDNNAVQYTSDVEIYFNGIKVRNIYLHITQTYTDSYNINNKPLPNDIIVTFDADLYIQDLINKYFSGKTAIQTNDWIEVKIRTFKVS